MGDIVQIEKAKGVPFVFGQRERRTRSLENRD